MSQITPERGSDPADARDFGTKLDAAQAAPDDNKDEQHGRKYH